VKKIWFNTWLDYNSFWDEEAESFSEIIEHPGDQSISSKASPRKWTKAIIFNPAGEEGVIYHVGYTYLDRQVSKISSIERMIGQGSFAIRIPPAEFGPFGFFIVSLTGRVGLNKLLQKNDFSWVFDSSKRHIPLFTPKIFKADSI